MLSLSNIYALISLIVRIIVYVASSTLIGIGQTLVNKFLGDSTAEDEGYLTFNPLMHFDVFGFIFMLITGFGWSGQIPFDPYAFQQPLRTLKLFISFMAKSFISAFLAFIALSIIALKFPSLIVAIFGPVANHICPEFMTAPPTPSVFLNVIGDLLFAIVFFNLALSIILGISNLIRFGLFMLFERGYHLSAHANIAITIIFPLLFIILFYETLRSVLLLAILYSAIFIARLFGVC